MAAGLGFKNFTSGEVLTAADVNGYLMQGILVFADATARDAAITSPQEGQFAFLKDTNVTTYYTGSAWANVDTTGMTNPMTTTGDTIYSSSGSTPARLGIGTTGQVLTVAGGVPTWATASSGGMTLLSTTTLSGADTRIQSISSSYKNLQIIVQNAVISAPGIMRLYTQNDTTNYYTEQAGLIDASTYTEQTNVGINLMNNTVGLTADFCINIYNYNSTTSKTFDVVGGFFEGGPKYAVNTAGVYHDGVAITEIDFGIDGATTYSSGTVLVYGVN
jgi:hypothetical protein